MAGVGVKTKESELTAKAFLMLRDGKILMLERSKSRFDGEGATTWGMAGGKIRKGENPTATVRREIEEETGAKSSVWPLQGNTMYSYPVLKADGSHKNRHAIFFVARTGASLDEIALSEEHINKTSLSIEEIRLIAEGKTANGNTLRLLRDFVDEEYCLSSETQDYAIRRQVYW